MRRHACWLVAYDVASPRRIARVHRLLRGWGLPTQYSVFVVEADRAGLAELVGEIAQRIDPRADDVRIYRIEPRPARSLGAATLPGGILAVGATGVTTPGSVPEPMTRDTGGGRSR